MLRGFMEDKVSRMMGYAVMRQLRATPGKLQGKQKCGCKNQKLKMEEGKPDIKFKYS